MTYIDRFCQNCGAELHGEYCSSCGQRDVDIHVPVKELASEFFEVLPSFDARLIRSLKPFLFHPGILTNEYLAGKRKRYVSPFKFYFIVSFLFFFVSALHLSGTKQVLRNEVLQADTLRSVVNGDTSDISIRDRESNLSFTIADTAKMEKLLGRNFIEAFKTGKNNPEMFFEKIKEHLPKIIFILLPVFALLLKLVYVRSKILYIKHLIFSFQFHSFIFFILLLDTLLEILLPASTHLYGNIMLFSIPAYLYIALRNVYRQSRLKTAIKFILLSLSHFFVFIFTISIFVIITILIFFA